jgi:methylmalonyl-CoA mutase N-terminal domain/subunit
VRGLEDGWFQRKIAQSAARQQWEIEQHRRVIVGVNEFVTDESRSRFLCCASASRSIASSGAARARARRARPGALRRAARALRQAARGSENVFPHILDCARAYCTLFEIRRALEDVFGAYREPVFF